MCEMNVRPLFVALVASRRVVSGLKVTVIIAALFAVALLAASCTGSKNGDAETREAGTRAPESKEERVVPVPEFELESLAGGKKSDTDYRGKVLLLNFWATWCAPCVAEMPSLERLHASFKDKGLEVVAVSVDPPGSKEELKAFVKKHGLTFEILLDPEISLPPMFGVSGFPETFFVGPDGILKPFYDPKTKKEALKVVSDRPWDSQVYLEAIGELLQRELNDTNPS